MQSRYLLASLAVSTSFLVAACSSGSSTSVAELALVPGTQVPVSATVDSAAATDFVSQIVAKGEANSEDPLTLGDATLATSESADPVVII